MLSANEYPHWQASCSFQVLLKYSLFKDVVYGRSFTKELETKTEELEMKHNRLAGLFKTGFIKETKPVMGDIKSSLEKASKIAQIQKLQRELEKLKQRNKMTKWKLLDRSQNFSQNHDPKREKQMLKQRSRRSRKNCIFSLRKNESLQVWYLFQLDLTLIMLS